MASHQGGRPPDGGIQPQDFRFCVEMQLLLTFPDDTDFFITAANDHERFLALETCLQKALPQIQRHSYSRCYGHPINIEKTDDAFSLQWSVASLSQLEEFKVAIQSKQLQNDFCEILINEGVNNSLQVNSGVIAVDVHWKEKQTTSEGKRHFKSVSGRSATHEQADGGVGSGHQAMRTPTENLSQVGNAENQPSRRGRNASTVTPTLSLPVGYTGPPRPQLQTHGLSTGVTKPSAQSTWTWSPLQGAGRRWKKFSFQRQLGRRGRDSQQVGNAENQPSRRGRNASTVTPTLSLPVGYTGPPRPQLQTHGLSTGVTKPSAQSTWTWSPLQGAGRRWKKFSFQRQLGRRGRDSQQTKYSSPNRSRSRGNGAAAEAKGLSVSSEPPDQPQNHEETVKELKGDDGTKLTPSPVISPPSYAAALADSNRDKNFEQSESRKGMATLRVHISQDVCEKKYLESVKVIIKEGDRELRAEMKSDKNDPSVWEVKGGFTFPFDYRYAYAVKGLMKWSLTRVTSYSDRFYYHEESISRTMGKPGEKYDLYNNGSDPEQVRFDGYCSHILTLVKSVDTHNLADVSWKLHHCLEQMRLKGMEKGLTNEVCRRLSTTKLSKDETLLTALLILECCQATALKNDIGPSVHATKVFSPATSKQILEHYTEIPKELLALHHEGLREILEYLLERVHGKSQCYLVSLHRSLNLPGTSEKDIEEQAKHLHSITTQSSQHTSFPIVSESMPEAEMKDMLQSVCRSLTDMVVQNQSLAAKQLLEKICEHFPLKVLPLSTPDLQMSLGEERLDSILESRLNDFFNEFDNSQRYSDLILVLAELREICERKPKILTRLKSFLTAHINSKSSSVDNLCTNYADDLLHYDYLWDAVFFNELSAIMSQSRNTGLHMSFIPLMKSKFAERLQTEEGLKLASSWITSALKYHSQGCDPATKSSRQNFPFPYCFLQMAMDIPAFCQPDIQDQLEKLVYSGFAQKRSVVELLKTVCATRRLNDDKMEDAMIRHLKQRLQDDSETTDYWQRIEEWIGSSSHSSHLTVNERIQAKVLCLCLDNYNLKEDHSDEEMMLAMSSRPAFWLSILKVRGIYHNRVTDHDSYKRAHAALLRTAKEVLEEQISCWLLNELIERKIGDNFVALVAWKGTNTQMEMSFSACCNVLSQAEIRMCNLHTAVDQVPEELQTNIPCFSQLVGKVTEMRRELRIGKTSIASIREISQPFWGPLRELIDSCRILLDLGQSNIFWTINKDILQDTDPEDLAATMEQDPGVFALECIHNLWDEGPPEGMETAMAILSTFATEGLKQYDLAWKPLFQGEDVPLKSVKRVMDSDNLVEEIEIACKYLHKELPQELRDGLLMYYHYDKYKEKIRAAKATLEALNYCADNDTSFKDAVDSFTSLQKAESVEDIHIHRLAETRRTLQPLKDMIEGEFTGVLSELAKGKGLVDFLRSVIKEDLRNWIDAVEDHSEQYVQESTVSNLIEVRRYLHQVLQEDLSKKTVAEIFCSLSRPMVEYKDLAKKINDCTQNLHGLKNLLSNMANRGEATKQIVLRTVRQPGTKFSFLFKSGHCKCHLQYESSDKTVEMKMEDVLDLRSRVLLLLNTEGRGSEKKGPEDVRQAYPKFVQYVDDAVQIADMIQSLWQLAHPDFYFSVPDCKFEVADLSRELERLRDAQQCWEDELKYCRSEYQGLNYFFPDQLWKIFSFFQRNENSDEVFALLQYAGCDSAAIDLACKSFKFEPVLSKLPAFQQVGQALDKISGHVNFTFPDFPEACFAHAKLTGMDKIEKGQLFIAALDENSSQVIPTLLTLYQNTTGSLPLPHQVLFCREETVWDEITLLLLRCSGAHSRLEKQLFCLVHVEKLSNRLQYLLVNELVQFCKKDFTYFAIICRGSVRHPFIDHFSEVVHHVHPMSSKALDTCLQELFPEVEVVTSDLPGQGKTEVIREMAHEEELEYVCLHVSGDFKQSAVMKTLKEMNITSQHLIHIDLALVSDPLELDNLIFEMVVFQCLNYRSALHRIPTKHIKIEVANTINDILLNSLKTTLHFHRRNLCWNDFTHFKFSMEICSPEQVVCHYLKARDSGQVGKTDLVFTGKAALKPLPGDECCRILQKQFESSTGLSFSAVHLFINILADQLKKLSCSSFMNVASLTEMAGEEKVKDIRTSFVTALVDVVENFSSRSVQACRSDQAAAVSLTSESSFKEDFLREKLMSTEASATAMTSRVDSMIRWYDSNHLVIVFHNQDIQTLSALYRDLRLVPPHVSKLFETQIKKYMPDFSTVSQSQLQQIVQRVARSSPDSLPEAELQKLNSTYALTPDNVLKMILIILRVKANVPVIIMGETGCGKTSLIRYLAAICGVDFLVLNVHAGTTDEDIVDFVRAAHAKATKNLKKQIWVFLDEINTCRHTGLINEVVCHHQCLGRPLAPNLVLMAACNPYKLRNQTSIHTAGLESKVKVDERSKLVYRVHPLPESMVDYVWDYGTLSSGTDTSDEAAYIARMVSGILAGDENQMIVEALVASQAFIRQVEQNEFCVSLRDVNRFRILFKWFQDTLPFKWGEDHVSYIICQAIAVLLAFAHVYHCRLPSNDKRRQYRTELSQIFSRYGWIWCKQETILNVINEEQKDLLTRMEVPEGTAKNTALQENVFVVLNCILNRMPVFLVGKPGCSKSLSLQLIKSNLRGKDSSDDYFKILPQLYFVSYQGSESSTSEGILKVFEKARKYREANKQEDVLPVVILDEIGLAEVSRFNPLKALHSLLEPGEQELPKVAVVGVSNWALDAAKMNRAIHLSRPDMDREELYRTGVSISEACMENTSKKRSGSTMPRDQAINKPLLKAIATAYDEYRTRQTIPNFHGLRDYYSLVKHVARALQKKRSSSKIAMVEGLLRNLGGVPDGLDTLKSIFQTHLQDVGDDIVDELRECSVLQLLDQNLNDKLARHLLLITHGDVAVSILEDRLKSAEPRRSFVTILGSKFEEDLTDDYNYRIISRIILHMEQGVVLILKDLESIYGSLYDMLNQNYTVVGTKKNCRIALGPYSNPLCQVHEDFRCIVLIEEQKLDLSDPPFLNRFEKQRLTLQDVLNEEEKSLEADVERWLCSLSDLEKKSFKVNDLLPVYGADLAPSLVHHVYLSAPRKSREEKVRMCKDYLLQMFTPDGILRANTSQLAKSNFGLVQDLLCRFLALPLHSGLSHYVENLVSNTRGEMVKSIVVTHSNPHTDVASCMAAISDKCQVERLGALKSEKQLSARSEQFWKTDVDKEWLIFQCSVSTDMGNFLLLKTTLEKHIRQYSSERRKNVIIVLHLDRTQRSSMLKVINFLMGWHLAFLDVLEKPDTCLKNFLGKTVLQLIQERDCVVHFVKRHLFWAFTRINYTSSERNIQSVQEIMKALLDEKDILHFVTNTVLTFLEHSDKAQDEDWPIEVACNVASLQSSSTLVGALERELQRFMEHPLAALIFQLENASALDPLRVDHGDERKRLWLQIARDRSIIDISQVEAPIGPECYPCHTPLQDLHHPFSRVLFNRIESLKERVLSAKHTRLGEAAHDEFDPLPEGFMEKVCSDYYDQICQRGGYMVAEQYVDQRENYLHDFAAMVSGPIASVQSHSCQWVMQWLLMKYMGDLGSCSFADFVVRLHCTFWLQEALIQTEYALISTCISVTAGSDDRGLQCIAGFFNQMAIHDSEAGMEDDGLHSGEHSDQDDVTEPLSSMLPRSESPLESDTSDQELWVDVGQNENVISAENIEISIQEETEDRVPPSRHSISSNCSDWCQDQTVSLSSRELPDSFFVEAGSDEDAQESSSPAFASRQSEDTTEPLPMISDTDDPFFKEHHLVNREEHLVAENGFNVLEKSSSLHTTAETFEPHRSTERDISSVCSSDENHEDANPFEAEIDHSTASSSDEGHHLEKVVESLHLESSDVTITSAMAVSGSALRDDEVTDEDTNAPVTNGTPDSSVGIFRTVGSLVALNEDLANIACKRLIPSDSLFKAGEMSLETWQHTVSMVLSLEKKISLASSRVSISSAVSQSLQVALDFQSCLSNFIPTEDEQRTLLTKLGQRLSEDGILSRSVFDFLLQLFHDPIFSNARAREALSHFFATYVTSCIRVDDEDNMPFIWSLEVLIEDNMMDHLTFFGPPLHCAFLMDIDPCFEGIQDLFTNDETMRKSMPLSKLDDCLQKVDEGSTHIMSLCVDVIEHFFLLDMKFIPQDPSFLELLHDCAACIKTGRFSLKLVVAVALLRKSMALMADRVLTTKTLTAAEMSAVQRLDKILTSFSSEHNVEEVNSLQRNFIRLLLQGGGVKTLQEMCSLLKDRCPLLGQLPLDYADCLNSLDFHLLTSGSVARDIQEAVLYKAKSKTELQQILQRAGHEEQVIYTVLATAVEHFYLVKSIRPLVGSEQDQMRSLSEICNNMSLLENLNRLIEFMSSGGYFPRFTLTESATEVEFQVASVFAHLACKIVAFNPSNITPGSAASFWVKCLQAPETLNSCFFPAAPDTNAGFQAFCFLPWLPQATGVVFCKCKCGTRTATTGTAEEGTCQLCKDSGMTLHREEKACNIAGDMRGNGKRGYSCLDPDNLKNAALAVRQLSPCAFRVLHLLIQCCLLGSVALGFTTREKLQKSLQTSAEGDVAETLYQQLVAHWEILASLTNLGPAQLGRFVHILIDQCFDANSPMATDLVEFKNRNRMEEAWSRRVDGCIKMRFTLLKDQAENFIKGKSRGISIVLESLTEEAAQDLMDCISSLFRETLPPSISILKAEYILQPDIQVAHPFIGLVLAKETQLSLLCCLQPVLSWHMMTVRMISYHLKKDEAKKMMVYEYIHSISETDRRKVVQNTFDAYQEAWDKLRSHKELLQKYFRPTLGPLAEVSIDSRLDECLALSSSSPMLQVLKALTEMHNEFLDDALILSLRSGSPSLGFLKQDAQHCCLKTVPLELVSKKQLIQLRLTDQHVSEMRFSQNCTQYGVGRKIEYNFYQYEMKWAHDLLMGAHYLSMGPNFPQVVFSGEILQRSASLLQDVNDVVPQCELDREMKKSVQALRERNPAHLRGLLESLEMAMSLLKKTSDQGSQDVESTSQYLERWPALLDLPSPDIMGFLKQVRLSQITGLFEFVEGLQAAMINETLAVEYRTELPAKALQTLNESVVAFSLTDLELLLQALQKFALRYLTFPSPGLDEQLYLHVRDPSLWPRTSLGEGRQCKAMSLMPHQLYVEHIYALLVYLEKAIANMKHQMEKTWISSSGAQPKKKTVEEDKRAKKKKVRKF